MRKIKWVGILLVINSFFIAYNLAYTSKYALNLMTYKEAYNTLNKMRGVGEVKANKIALERARIRNIKALDTEKIKYSKYFTIRSWDMRTDVMFMMFIISLVIQTLGFFYIYYYVAKKGITVNVNKYVALGDIERKE